MVLWLLGIAVVVAAIAFLVVPRLRERPPTPPDEHPGPPTMGRDPKGPPAP